MNILLITPKIPNNIASFFHMESDPYGGWIEGLLNSLSKKNDLNIDVITFKIDNVNRYTNVNENSIRYHYLQYTNPKLISNFFETHSYDIYHVVGIEHTYIKDIISFLPVNKTLLNITGLNCECAKHYFDDITSSNPLLRANIFYQSLQASKKGKIEIKALRHFKYATGRTEWDKNVIKSINEKIKYYSCNEILRDVFYSSQKWNISKIQHNSIYVSQASYSIKGGAHLIAILSELKKIEPNFQCYIAGEDIIHSNSLMTKLHGSYGSYLKKLIIMNHLENNIHFLGQKNAKEVIKEMLNSNVFLLTSSIENSSNSLQEAMLLGMPCIVSKVGGLPSIAPESAVLFYDFTNVKQAAISIANIFSSDHLAQKIGSLSSKHIEKIANPKFNGSTMISIYQTIMEENK